MRPGFSLLYRLKSVFITSAPINSSTVGAVQPPVYRPAPQPKKKAPRRKATPLEDIGYTLWALCIAVSVAATALCFLIGAVS